METIDVLQVRHTRVDTESIAYTYTLLPAHQSPQLGSGVVRHRDSRAELEKALLDAATDIREIASGSALPAGPSFHALGTTLREKYLLDQVLAFLFPEHPTPLLIDTDDPEFPWEVVHDGTRFLGTYRQLGRQLPDQECVRSRPAHWGNHRQALLVLLGYGTAFATEFDEGERVVDAPQESGSRPATTAPPDSKLAETSATPKTGTNETMALERQIASIHKLCTS